MRRYIIVGIAAIIIVVLSVTLYILFQRGGQELVFNALTKGQFVSPPTTNAGTIVSFTVNKTKNGTVLIIAWRNLPNGTKELIVWKASSGTAAWAAWQTISVSAGGEGSGSATIDIGTLDLKNFDFSIQALGNTDGNTATERVLWTSPIIVATTTASGTITFVYNSTSTPNLPPPSSRPPAAPTPTPSPATPATTTNTTPSQTATGTTPTTTTPSSPAPTSSTSGGSNTNPATYYYTYTPQQTPSAQAAPGKGSFWVQHVNQSIEIGWQNLPSTTNKIVVSRSPNQTGPWTAILTQYNPDPTGPYSIKLVDNTLNNPYYYKLDTFTNSTFIQTYGPEYLGPI